MKARLLVHETQTIIEVDWFTDPEADLPRGNYGLWYHPECIIYYTKAATVRRSSYEAVANAIMQALQSANMRVSALRYMRRTPCRKPKKGKDQPRLI